jgi:hypothetical protein
VQKAGKPPVKNTCRVKIYGMSEELMNLCTVVPALSGKTLYPAHKKVYLLVEGGDFFGLSRIFVGEITEAYASYQSPPNMCFHIDAATGHYPHLATALPRGYAGPTAVEQIVSDIASAIGYSFQNNGFHATISNPYLTGSAMEQLRQLHAAVPMEMQVDDLGIYIAPKGTPRIQAGQVPFISPSTGLVEYPIFDKHGLRFSTLYNPGIVYGGQVYVQSSIVAATGYWKVEKLEHELESNNPSGKWLSRVHASFLKGQ